MVSWKIFPATLTHDGRKVPISEMSDWKLKATNDQNIISQWSYLYAHKTRFWGVPTGKANGIIVIDVDVKDNGYETLKKYQTPLTLSQKTLSGGMHLIYSIPEGDNNHYGNRVRFDVGLDIRADNGYIIYYGVDSTPIAEAPQWLLEQSLSAPKEVVDLSTIVKVSHDIVDKMLEEACDNIRNAPQGEANNTLNIESYKIGQLIPSGSIDRDYAFNELFKAAKDRGKLDPEARATINSGFKGGASTPYTNPFGDITPTLIIPETRPRIVERWTPFFFSRADLVNFTKLKKPQLFKDWSTEDITITSADGGTGKTTLKLNEAIALALGEPFLGFECVAPGRTLFITGEDSYEKLGAMLGAILKQMGLLDGSPENEAKVRQVTNNVLVKKDIDLRLVVKDTKGYIVPNPEALQKLTEAIEDLRPKMIVFDPIASFWGREADLNDMTIAVAKFMGILVERSNACVEAINHVGKAASSSKDMSQFAGRGGTGLPSHARVSRALRPVWDEEFKELTNMDLGDRGAIMCNINKFSDGSPHYNKPFLIVRNGFLFERLTLIEQKQKEEVSKMSDVERVIIFINGERRSGRYPTKNIVIAEFFAHSDKIPRERVSRALDFLQYRGHLGEFIKMIDNPDIEMGGKVFIITDHEGKELK